MTNRAWIRQPRETAPRGQAVDLLRTRPGLEQLEDRRVPTGGLSLNQDYVAQLYQDVLGRLPDPAGIDYWSGSLDQGLSRGVVAGQLMHTSEALTRSLDNLYEHYLGRQADASGIAAFVPLLASGQDEQVQAQLLGSPEYSQFHQASSLHDFLAHLYLDVLGRPADAAAEAYFGGAQFGGNRTAIALAVVSSPEANRVLVQQDYDRFLQREPDSAGAAYWANALTQSANSLTFAQAIVGSDEYFDSPHANNDAASTKAGMPVTFDVAANDIRLFGRSYEVALEQNPANGSAAVNPDGSIIYAPSAGFIGVDILTYRLQTAAGSSSLGIVTITVEPAK
jgi:Bacterial Ig domain/Domain of unknown function (DUF4214)